jgi:hypothetical protein
LATLLTLATGVSFSQKPQFEECSGRKVAYEPFDQQFAAKMTIQPWASLRRSSARREWKKNIAVEATTPSARKGAANNGVSYANFYGVSLTSNFNRLLPPHCRNSSKAISASL